MVYVLSTMGVDYVWWCMLWVQLVLTMFYGVCF